jgi:hypothetical protein
MAAASADADLTCTRRAAVVAVAAGALPRLAPAGAQLEEPLADSVRSALSAAIAADAPPRPSFVDMEQRLVYLRWLGAPVLALSPRWCWA